MITLNNERQLADILRRLREYRGFSGRDLADRIFADRRTVRGREIGQQGYTVAALIDTAQALGYRVALIGPEEQA